MSPNDFLVVLLSGPMAVGKTSVRQALMVAHGFDYVRSSAYLKELAAQQDLGESGRTSLQDLGDDLDLRTDYRWVLDDVARPGFAASPAQRRWLVDAVRKERQVMHFRDAFGASVLHVHLTASEEVLLHRYTTRLASAGDATPYEIAIQHDNEVASRSLIGIADVVLDTGALPAERIAELVLEATRMRPVHRSQL